MGKNIRVSAEVAPTSKRRTNVIFIVFKRVDHFMILTSSSVSIQTLAPQDKGLSGL